MGERNGFNHDYFRTSAESAFQPEMTPYDYMTACLAMTTPQQKKLWRYYGHKPYILRVLAVVDQHATTVREKCIDEHDNARTSKAVAMGLITPNGEYIRTANNRNTPRYRLTKQGQAVIDRIKQQIQKLK